MALRRSLYAGSISKSRYDCASTSESRVEITNSSGYASSCGTGGLMRGLMKGRVFAYHGPLFYLSRLLVVNISYSQVTGDERRGDGQAKTWRRPVRFSRQHYLGNPTVRVDRLTHALSLTLSRSHALTLSRSRALTLSNSRATALRSARSRQAPCLSIATHWLSSRMGAASAVRGTASAGKRGCVCPFPSRVDSTLGDFMVAMGLRWMRSERTPGRG